MGIVVYCDETIEGMELKRALETLKLSDDKQKSFIVRWNNYKDGVDTGIVLNTSLAIRNTVDKENVLRTLKRNHIRCPKKVKPRSNDDFPVIGRNKSWRGIDVNIIENMDDYENSDYDYYVKFVDILYEYRIHAAGINVFYIEEKYNDGKVQPVSEIRSCRSGWKYRKADMEDIPMNEQYEMEDLAVKAIYSMGLDFGAVTVVKAVDERYYVLDVETSLKHMTPGCLNEYIVYIKDLIYKYQEALADKQNVTLGADPECVLKNKKTGGLVFASDFFPESGCVGVDGRSIEAGGEHHPLLEIRPPYAYEPVEVVESMKGILKGVANYIGFENIGIYAGSMPVYNYWIGGHIHFGIEPNFMLVRALDNYLALPLMMVEKVYSARKRRIRYGALGDFRLKSYGGFEYRALSSWLISPEIALAVLSLAKIVVQEYRNLTRMFLCNYKDIRAYYRNDKEHFREAVKKSIKDIRNLRSYKIYGYSIEPLFSMILQNRVWDEDKPINKAWGIKSNGKIYEPVGRCYIPRRKREEFNIGLNNIINIWIGNMSFNLTVYPKDDFFIKEDGFISFSGDVSRKAGINETDELYLWFDTEDMVYRAGPVFGILTGLEADDRDIFKKQEAYFKKLIKFTRYKGMVGYIFTLSEVEWSEGRTKGYIYDLQKKRWVVRYFSLPDIVYDRRCHGEDMSQFIHNTGRLNIKFINSPECISLLLDKMKTYQLLASSDRVKRLINKDIYLSGSKSVDYIVQAGERSSKLKNQNMQFRIIMQKNSSDLWVRIAIGICRNNRSGIKQWDTFEDNQGKITTTNILEIIKQTSSDIVSLIDMEDMQIGEFSMDFVTYDGNNIYISDINPVPDSLFSMIKTMKMRNLAVNRILDYGKLLVCKQ